MLPSDLRHMFPVTATRAYLFSGGLAPAAQPVKAAIQEWVDRWAYDPGYHRARYFDEWETLRRHLATLIGAEPDEIAITDNTSRGSNLIAAMLDVPPGTNVVVDATTYPSSLYAWHLPRRHEVEVRMVRSEADRPDIDDFARLVDDRTLAISISHVSALTGFRHDLPRLAELAHAHHAYLIVDVAQSAGAVQFDVRAMGVDFASGTFMKWLLGAPGVGFLFVNRACAERLAPPQAGYVGTELAPVRDEGDALQFRAGARRHELGLASPPCLPACRVGLDLLLGVGLREVERGVLTLSGACIEGLVRRGLRPLTPEDPRQRAGVVAVAVARAEALAEFLRLRGVDVWGYPTNRLRVDPHIFNNPADLERFFDGLDQFLAHGERAT